MSARSCPSASAIANTAAGKHLRWNQRGQWLHLYTSLSSGSNSSLHLKHLFTSIDTLASDSVSRTKLSRWHSSESHSQVFIIFWPFFALAVMQANSSFNFFNSHSSFFLICSGFCCSVNSLFSSFLAICSSFLHSFSWICRLHSSSFFAKYSNALFPNCAFKRYLRIFSDPCLRFRFFSSSVLVTSASFSLSFFATSEIYWAPHLTGIMMARTVPITVPSSVFDDTFSCTHKTSSPVSGFTSVTRSGSLIRSLFRASVRFLITSAFILFSLFQASFQFSLFRASFWFSLVLASSTGSIARSTGTAATSAGSNIVSSLFTFPDPLNVYALGFGSGLIAPLTSF